MTIVERLNRATFRLAVRSITRTPPVAAGRNRFAALSMVNHRDVLAYLLAIKTFARHAAPARIVVVADPDLDGDDRALLKDNIPHVEVLEAAGFRRPALPTGGTWERLSAISELVREMGVVQLDSDTMTFAVPREVIDAMASRRSFVLASEGGLGIVGLREAADYGRASRRVSNHVQAAAEAALDQLEMAADLRYVRGCSGFAGFAAGSFDPGRLDRISSQMHGILNARWNEWGTEQVTSNLIAASGPGAMVLPHPQYCNADSLGPGTIVAHFIGYARHVNREYQRRASDAVSMLRCA